MPEKFNVRSYTAETESLGSGKSSFTFRPIHYLGSKLRVLDAIESAIDLVDPSGGPVCDLFSGSATVSRYLSRHRRVMAVDIQEYARMLAEATLNGYKPGSISSFESALASDQRAGDLRKAIDPLIALENMAGLAAKQGEIEPLCEILESSSLESSRSDSLVAGKALADPMRASLARIDALGLPDADTVCIRHFGGQYFSYQQAADLDAIAVLARNSRSFVPLAATLSTASHLVNSIGKQFAQPIRPRDKSGAPKHHVVKKIIAERGLSVTSVFMNYLQQYCGLVVTRRDHVAVRADFREALAKPPLRPAVVYADPPYTRDHYSRFYHSLETIALGDDPSITKSNLGGGRIESRGSYRAGRHQSPFCIKSQAPDAFSALFAGVASLRVPLVLSYSGYDPSMEARPRVMALDAVIALAMEHFNDVHVKPLANLEHSKLNTSSLNKASKGTTEVLLICR